MPIPWLYVCLCLAGHVQVEGESGTIALVVCYDVSVQKAMRLLAGTILYMMIGHSPYIRGTCGYLWGSSKDVCYKVRIHNPAS